MAGKDATATAEPENALLGSLTADKFQGFSTKDGEVVKGSAAKPAKAAAKPAPSADVEDDTEDQGEQAGEAEAKPAKPAQERINKAVGKQRAAERRADAAEAANRTLEQRFAALEGKFSLLTSGNTTPKKDPNAPDPNDYKHGDIDARYIADLAVYSGTKAAKTERETSDKAAKTTADAKAAAALTKKVNDFSDKWSEKYEDFHDVVFDDDFPVSATLGELAIESDHGGEILYTLLSGPAKEAKRVLGLTPARQAAWFGAKEADMPSESSDADEEVEPDEEPHTPPKATRSPQPSSFKTRGNGGVPRVNASTTDFAAFERMTKQGAGSR